MSSQLFLHDQTCKNIIYNYINFLLAQSTITTLNGDIVIQISEARYIRRMRFDRKK